MFDLIRVSDATIADFADDVTMTKGSNIVSVTAHGLAVGTYINLNGGTYKITATTTNTITIDVAYQGDTETILVAAQAAAFTGAASAITEWGFKLTGLPQNSKISRAANEPLDEYEWVDFTAGFNIAGEDATLSANALVTKTQGQGGQGYWKQIADIEEKAKGYLGDTDKRNYYAQRIASNVVVDQDYGSVIITHEAAMKGDFQGNYQAPLQTEVYIPSGSAQGVAAGNAFLDILNGFFGASNLGFADIATFA